MVTNDYSIEKISLAIDEVLSATNETDEQILTRMVMKQLLDKANQTSKKKRTSPKQKPLTSDMVNYIIGVLQIKVNRFCRKSPEKILGR